MNYLESPIIHKRFSLFQKCVFKKSSLLLAALIISAGCEMEDIADLSYGNTDNALENDTESQQDVSGEWRDGRDVATLEALNNMVMWETRNVEAPTRTNLPGDYEWIIARIEGSGFRRLLIMTMHTSGGVRSPSRIFFEGFSWYKITDGTFPVPLPGPSLWSVEYSAGALRVYLDGTEIWSATGNFSVDRAIMTDSGRRGFLGEWRAVQ